MKRLAYVLAFITITGGITLPISAQTTAEEYLARHDSALESVIVCNAVCGRFQAVNNWGIQPSETRTAYAQRQQETAVAIQYCPTFAALINLIPAKSHDLGGLKDGLDHHRTVDTMALVRDRALGVNKRYKQESDPESLKAELVQCNLDTLAWVKDNQEFLQ